MSQQVKKADICPNCNESLHGENFCPNCGQKNDVRRIRLRHFISESLSNFFAVDGRFMHTLRVLLWKPGLVAKNYIEGKRQRYVHPVRMYFLASILLLFIIEYAGNTNEIVNVTSPEEVENPADIEGVVTDPDSLLVELSNLQNADSTKSAEEDEEPGMISSMLGYYEESGEMDSRKALDALEYKNNLINRFLYHQSTKIAEFDDEEFSKYFASKLFWVLFLFLPILAGVNHLLYYRRNFYYPEHLFFTFYNQTSFFIVLSVGISLAYFINNQEILIVFVLTYMVYQYLSLLRFYGQSKRKTFLKFFILNLLSLPLFAIFFIIAALFAFIIF